MDLNTLLKHTSRSLYLSVKMLPAKMRPAFGLAYLLCRYADTIADTELLPAPRRLYWVEKFPQWVRQEDASAQADLVRELSGTSENPYEAQLIAHLADCLDALKKIEPVLKPFIYEVVQAVCAGMKMDLQTFANQKGAAPVAFANERDLTHYCRLMGGMPGLFWSKLIVYTTAVKVDSTELFAWGQQIGDALQMVNILRDLPQDLQNGRCYFPQTDLQSCALTVQELQRVENSSRFEPIKIKWTRWGKENLKQAARYYRALPKTAWRVRAAVAWPILWTADTFMKLCAAPDLLNPAQRVKISRARVYGTMFVTPLILLSNRLFEAWLARKLKKLP